MEVASTAAGEAAHQPPALTISCAPPFPVRHVPQQLARFREGTDPEQSAEAAAIDQHMKRLLQIQAQIRKALEGERIGAAFAGMASVAEAFSLSELGGAQAAGSAPQMSLLQPPSAQAPAERSPRERSGSRAR